MDKKIKLSKIIFPSVLVLGFLLTACMDDFHRHHYYYDNVDASYGLIQTNTSGASFVINLDNGSVVTPSNVSLNGFTPKDSDRVWVRFNPVSDTRLTDSTFNYLANIYSINDILFKDIKKLSDVSEDSVGHDPIIIRSAWISPKDILNLELKFFTAGSVHYINLLDNGEGDGVSNPFIMELRHNARGDMNQYPVYATVSFKLNNLRVSGQNQVKFFIRYTDYNGNRIDIPRTYNY
jgi:hypothetical protein